MDEKDKAYFSFLKELLEDRTKNMKFMKVLSLLNSLICLALVVGLIIFGIHCQKMIKEEADTSQQRMYSFLLEYDFSSSIDLDTGTITDSDSSGNITYTRN